MNTTISLPAEQQAQIRSINESFESKVRSIDERRQYRMENYYNCVDDYSFGGICDKADNELEDRCRVERGILIEQVQNGGYYVRTSSFYRLRDNEGHTADGASNGQYGSYFDINGKRVGVPKKVATLEKKGYTLELVTRKYKCVFKGFSSHGNVLNKEMKCIEESVTHVTQETMPEYIGRMSYIDYQYSAYFA